VDEAGLAHLAVVDHVDAELYLPPHDVPDRLPEPAGVRGRVHGPARRSRRDHLEQSTGRGRLPAWVVRILSVLPFIGSPPWRVSPRRWGLEW
jgi:hypothetical protein